jgi:hypothetical protein
LPVLWRPDKERRFVELTTTTQFFLGSVSGFWLDIFLGWIDVFLGLIGVVSGLIGVVSGLFGLVVREGRGWWIAEVAIAITRVALPAPISRGNLLGVLETEAGLDCELIGDWERLTGATVTHGFQGLGAIDLGATKIKRLLRNYKASLKKENLRKILFKPYSCCR